MNARTRTLGLAAVVMTLSASAATVACMAPTDDGVDDGSSAVSTRERFDKDDLIADRDFLNRNGMTPDQVQRFLERTPYGTRSILATYRDPRTSRTAAEIIYEASARYGLNPLLLLVRLQMEQGLIRASSTNDRVYAETQRGAFNPSESSMDIAFGCGCPHSPVCNDDYRGFANQAECAAGTLRRSFERATSREGTVEGWSVGRAKRTNDGITVTPRNAATAALYTYTPWVGQAGGGRQGIGGASLHWQTWFRFADAVGYRITGSSADCQNYRTPSTTSSSGGYVDCQLTSNYNHPQCTGRGASSSGGYVDCSLRVNQYDPQCTGRPSGVGASSGSYRYVDCSDPRFQSDPTCTGRGLTQNCDQWFNDAQRWGYGASGGYGATSSSGGSYGGSSGWGGSSSGGYGATTSSSSSGALPPVGYDAGAASPAAPPPPAANPNNDQQVLGSSSGAPAANAPPPRGSGSSSSSSSGGSSRSGDEEEEEKVELAERKADSGGCSTTGTGGRGAASSGLVGLGLAALALASRRRRA